MGIKFKGRTPKEIAQELAQDADEKIVKVMTWWIAGAFRVMNESMRNAPVDKHNLEAAHKFEVVRADPYRFLLAIEVSGEVRGVNVSQYAWIMHDTQYQLGPKSQAKQAAGKNQVGRLFLDRAFDDTIPQLVEIIEDHMTQWDNAVTETDYYGEYMTVAPGGSILATNMVPGSPSFMNALKNARRKLSDRGF